MWLYLNSFWLHQNVQFAFMKAERPQVIDRPEPELVAVYSAPGNPDWLTPTQTNTLLITFHTLITAAEGSRWW